MKEGRGTPLLATLAPTSSENSLGGLTIVHCIKVRYAKVRKDARWSLFIFARLLHFETLHMRTTKILI
jgi:hypothetical protein